MMKKMDLLVTGVGGQGVVLASDIIAETAIAAGFDVKKTDTLGMAQRGGSVVTWIPAPDLFYLYGIGCAGMNLIKIPLVFPLLKGGREGTDYCAKPLRSRR